MMKLILTKINSSLTSQPPPAIGYFPKDKVTPKSVRKSSSYKSDAAEFYAVAWDFVLEPMVKCSEQGFQAKIDGLTSTYFPRIIAIPMDYPELIKATSCISNFCPQCSFLASDDPNELPKVLFF